MFKYILLFIAVAYVAAQSPTVSTSGPGVLTVTWTIGTTNWAAWGLKNGSADTFPGWGYACSPATYTSGVPCREFTCTAAASCVLGAAAPTGSTQSGSAATLAVTFTRNFASSGATDPGISIGSNATFIKNDTADTASFAASTIQGVTWTAGTITVTQRTADPSFTYALKLVASDVVSITMTTQTNKLQGLGWKTGTNTWPDWVVMCNAQRSTCLFATCSAFGTCVAATGASLYSGVQVSLDAATGVVVIQRSTTGPSTTTITSGAQTGMLWGEYAISATPTITDVNTRTWSMFTTSPNITAYTSTAPSFGFSMVQTSATLVNLVFTTVSGNYAAAGWQMAGSMYPSYVVGCDPTLTVACVEFTCSSMTACAAATYAGSVVGTKDATARTVTFTRAVSPATPAGAHTIVLGQTQKMLWLQASNTGLTAIAAAQVQSTSYTSFQTTITPFSGTKPTFGITATATAAATTAFTITTNSGKYAMAGINSGVENYPSFVAVCEPATLAECGIYTCTSNSACVAYAGTTAVTQTRDQVNRIATVVFPSTLLPAGGTTYLYWVETAIPSAGLTLAPALAQGQTWALYLLSIAPVSTPPTFSARFTRTTDTTLVASFVPGSTVTMFFGWRLTSSAFFPTDALICAPGAVSTCLDVSCTSATACTARTTTIYTANSASGSSASVTRTLTAGDVKLADGGTMYLTWDTITTPSGTTTLNATDAQNRSTWKYYSLPVPSVGSTNSSIAFGPALLAGLLALVYLA